jgi:hypothetical protein
MTIWKWCAKIGHDLVSCIIWASKWRIRRNIRTTLDSTDCEGSEPETFWVCKELSVWWVSVAKFRQSWQWRNAGEEYFFNCQVANMAATVEPLLLNIVICSWKCYCCNCRTLVELDIGFCQNILYIHRFLTPYMSAVCVRSIWTPVRYWRFTDKTAMTTVRIINSLWQLLEQVWNNSTVFNNVSLKSYSG